MTRTRLPEGFYDICWLDCPEPGRLITHQGREICLCDTHHYVLERGRWGDSYEGAPLPVVTKASAWPWRDIAQAA